MGCTPNFEKIKEHQDITLQHRETIEIEYINQNALKTEKTQKTQAHTQANCDDLETALKAAQNNENIIEKEKKIQLLQGSKNFMEISIQASSYVNQALLALSTNPLLYDQSYPKLIGINKKTLLKKQNRYSYLAKREQKAELQLKKQKQKITAQYRKSLFNKQLQKKQPSKSNHSHKQNRLFPSLFSTVNKEKYNMKAQKISAFLQASQRSL